MTYTSIDFRDLLPESIWLEPEQFEQAVQMSQAVTGESEAWEAYIHALALLSFTQWLREREQDLTIHISPPRCDAMGRACYLEVDGFRICIVGAENILNEVVIIPRAAIELEAFAAHFYVVIEVLEEQEEAIIRGFLRSNQLIQERNSFVIQPDWTYQISLDLFDREPTRLLCDLKYLNPEMLPLGASTPENTTLSLTSGEIDTLLSSLPATQGKLWQYFNWEQGAKLLASPTFSDAFTQWTTQAITSIRFREILALLTQPTINTATWLQRGLDELSLSLGLFKPAFSWRSIPQFEGAIAYLRDTGLDIPTQIFPVYQDFILDGRSLCLCILSWPTDNRWSSLVILGTQLGEALPVGIKLQVSKLTGIVEDPELEQEELFLYALVEGNWGEKFIVTIVPVTGNSLTLTPYTFELESV